MKRTRETMPLRKIANIMYVKSGVADTKLRRNESGWDAR